MSASLAKSKKAQALVNAYHRVFGGKDGALILEDFRKSFGLHMPAFIPQTRGEHCEYDPLHAAIRDGQRQVMIHIEARLATPAGGDANVEKPAVEVKT